MWNTGVCQYSLLLSGFFACSDLNRGILRNGLFFFFALSSHLHPEIIISTKHNPNYTDALLSDELENALCVCKTSKSYCFIEWTKVRELINKKTYQNNPKKTEVTIVLN